MVGIVLVTHNGLGESLVDCLKHVLGSIPQTIKAMSVHADHNPEEKEAELRKLVAQLDRGRGVLILVDVYGATPANIAQRVCVPGRIEGVAGVNLPMLLRVACCCTAPLPDMVHRALHGGKECIVSLNSEMEACDAATRCADHQ